MNVCCFNGQATNALKGGKTKRPMKEQLISSPHLG